MKSCLSLKKILKRTAMSKEIKIQDHGKGSPKWWTTIETNRTNRYTQSTFLMKNTRKISKIYKKEKRGIYHRLPKLISGPNRNLKLS